MSYSPCLPGSCASITQDCSVLRRILDKVCVYLRYEDAQIATLLNLRKIVQGIIALLNQGCCTETKPSDSSNILSNWIKLLKLESLKVCPYQLISDIDSIYQLQLYGEPGSPGLGAAVVEDIPTLPTFGLPTAATVQIGSNTLNLTGTGETANGAPSALQIMRRNMSNTFGGCYDCLDLISINHARFTIAPLIGSSYNITLRIYSVDGSTYRDYPLTFTDNASFYVALTNLIATDVIAATEITITSLPTDAFVGVAITQGRTFRINTTVPESGKIVVELLDAADVVIDSGTLSSANPGNSYYYGIVIIRSNRSFSGLNLQGGSITTISRINNVAAASISEDTLICNYCPSVVLIATVNIGFGEITFDITSPQFPFSALIAYLESIDFCDCNPVSFRAYATCLNGLLCLIDTYINNVRISKDGLCMLDKSLTSYLKYCVDCEDTTDTTTTGSCSGCSDRP